MLGFKQKEKINEDNGGSTKTGKIKRNRRDLENFRYFMLQTLISVLILYILFAFIIGVMSMPNADMYPRLDSGDFLMYYRLDKDPKAQDIMVFEKNNTRYVGRVIAVGGDTVDISEKGVVSINGYSMQETNIFFETYPLEGFVEYPVKLAKDEYFILADHREGVEDSRFFGPVKKSELQGTVITVLRRNNL